MAIEYEESDRGFKQYGPIETDYGHVLRVYESSAATRPCLWLSVDPQAAATKDRGGRELGVHMTLDEAVTLRDTIDRAIEKHYQKQ